MPYSIPSPTSPTLTLSAPATATAADPSMRPLHRRARSAGMFSDERGPGAFASLGALPRRHSRQTTPTMQAPPPPPPPPVNNRKQPVFRISVDEDDSDSTNDSDHDHNENETSLPPRPARPSPGLHISTIPLTLRDNAKVIDNNDDTLAPPQSIPFPRTSPLSPPVTGPTSPPTQVRASGSITRSGSHPVVLLANGKPLKSSLKSSSSAPHIPTPVSHMRAQSAPSTPNPFVIKNVHFAEKGLEDIRVFSRTAKPLSVSSPAAADATETETETENDYFTFGSGSVVGSSGRNAFPFPKAPAATTAVSSATSGLSSSSNPSSFSSASIVLEIDPAQSSLVPSTTTSSHAHVVLESLVFHTPTQQQQEVRGTLLLRNVAFEKHALVRFTLDGWQTTSEVSARYVASLPALPTAVLGGGNAGASGSVGVRTMGDAAANVGVGYDRFAFTINLTDYGSRLADRTLVCAAMYKAAGGEWWDNNAGANYRVGFRRSSASAAKATSTPLASAPGVERKTVGFSQSAPSTPAAAMYAPTLPIPSATSIVAPPPIRNVNRPVLAGLKTTGMTGAPAAPSSGGSTPSSSPSSPIVSPIVSPLATHRPKLSLLNYVAPVTSPVAVKPSNTDVTPNADNKGNNNLMVPPKDQQPLTPPMTPERELRALPFTGTSNSASPVPSPTHSPTRVFTDINSTEDVPTPTGRPGSPVSRTPPGVHWPWGTSSPSLSRPMMSFGGGGAGVGGGGSNDALYQAMVREWCFAQSPVPTPPERQASPPSSHSVAGVGLAH